jgi:5-methylcytosine-specific restriction endonuclease McrBC GTP-binding regulatory subunit McrB
MTDRAQKLIKYIFETEIDKIEGSRLSENKGLSALCLLYKTDLNPEELSKKYGVNIQFNNINTASVPEFISEISKYIDIKVFQSKPENQSKTELASKFKSVNIIFYGAPGTGKSYKVDKIIENLDLHYYERITFHPEYDNASFIGGYKPISEKDSSGSDTIKYKFVPQAFTNIYERAWQDLDNQYYLVIEEINRGNCAEIFGEIFQLLDRTSKYTVSPTKELKEYLINEAFKDENHLGIVNGLKLPPNLSILATMNTSDQSLFPMDSAFKRRWDWEYIPICYNPIDDFKKKNDSFDFEIDIEDGKKYSWIKFIEKVNLNHIKNNPSLGMDKCIGNYFIKPDKDNIISLRPFVNKVIFYLWNDVFKDEDNKVFEDNTSYEDFFPIDTNGKKKIKELFDRIDLKAIPSLEIVEDENPLGQVAESPEEMES